MVYLLLVCISVVCLYFLCVFAYGWIKINEFRGYRKKYSERKVLCKKSVLKMTSPVGSKIFFDNGNKIVSVVHGDFKINRVGDYFIEVFYSSKKFSFDVREISKTYEEKGLFVFNKYLTLENISSHGLLVVEFNDVRVSFYRELSVFYDNFDYNEKVDIRVLGLNDGCVFSCSSDSSYVFEGKVKEGPLESNDLCCFYKIPDSFLIKQYDNLWEFKYWRDMLVFDFAKNKVLYFKNNANVFEGRLSKNDGKVLIKNSFLFLCWDMLSGIKIKMNSGHKIFYMDCGLHGGQKNINIFLISRSVKGSTPLESLHPNLQKVIISPEMGLFVIEPNKIGDGFGIYSYFDFVIK